MQQVSHPGSLLACREAPPARCTQPGLWQLSDEWSEEQLAAFLDHCETCAYHSALLERIEAEVAEAVRPLAAYRLTHLRCTIRHMAKRLIRAGQAAIIRIIKRCRTG